MSLFRTPPGVKTRAQSRKELATNTEEKRNLKVKSDVQYDRIGKICEPNLGSPRASSSMIKRDGGASENVKSSHASSSAARRQRLEYEAAEAKAKIDLEELQAQARIKKELVAKKLAADIAELETQSHSLKSTAASYQRVENWLEKSVAAPGTSLDRCNNQVTVGNGDRNISSNCRAHPPTDGAAVDNHRAIEELTCAIKNAVEASNSHSNGRVLLSRLATSKDLPLYHGDPLEWLQFREAFYESTRVCKYSDIENMWRLRKCLRGEAREAASALLMGASSPCDVMAALELRFGRPETVMRQVSIQLRKLSPLPDAYHAEIIKFAIKIKNFVTAITTVKQIDYLRSPELITIVISKLPTGLVNKWVEYLYENQTLDETPRLELLSRFLYTEAQKVAESGVSYIHHQNDFGKNKPEKRYFNQQSVLTSVKTNDPDTAGRCKFCRKNEHTLPDCSKFKRAMRKDRWRFARYNKLCFKCLGTRHPDQTTCTAESCDVEACGGPHHRLLHWTKPAARQATSTPPDYTQKSDDGELVSHASAAQCAELSVRSVPKKSETLSGSKVVLKIVPITVHGPNASVNTHALLDDGATVTLIAADLADKVGLHGKKVTMRASGAWNSELVCQTELINCAISNSDGEKFELRARKFKELDLPLQFAYNVDLDKHVPNINQYLYCENKVKPKILIGQDNYELIAPLVCKRYASTGPFITRTLLGWCLHGSLRHSADKQAVSIGAVSDPCAGSAATLVLNQPGKAVELVRRDMLSNCSADASASSCFNILAETSTPIDTNNTDLCTIEHSTDIDLHDLIRRSFSLDSIGICNKPRQNIDEVRAVNIINESAELIDGQWTVNLPWKLDSFSMPNSYPVALKRLKSVEQKMLNDSDYENRYRERMQHLFDNNYARKLDEIECRVESTSDHIWYLPHFGVDNPNKKKLRLVFDAAAKCNNMSLNDFLLQGPDLLQSLYGIMFRFRENRIGLIGDIKDMFLRIKINSTDQTALRFLWKEKDCDVINKYAMTSLIFGANCSPFIAQFINQTKNASRFLDQMPEAVHAIKNNQYMDDYIDSFADENVARKMVKEVLFIHSQGGFQMRNWLSNVPNVLDDIPKNDLSDLAIRFNFDKQPERALGILWFPCSDMLALDLSFKRLPEDILLLKRIPTKREMLRIVMSIFDVHGYLTPFTIKGKILMRKIWERNIKWDDKLNDDLYDSFRKWISQAQEINNIRIPRWYFSTELTSDSFESLEIHMFSDASPSAYAAVAYWRRESIDGRVTVSFIASKCKVTPLKPVSVPRLELQGAVLACKLANSIKKEHRLQPNSVYYWTDSTTVLHWIKNQCRTYKVFIANRLGEIDEVSKSDDWHYVPTGMNVADLGTKNNDYVLSSDSEWFLGPSFLHQSRSCWPQQPEIKIINDDILEKVQTVQENNIICNLPVPEPSRFSSWLRLLRTTATVLLFIEKCRKSSIVVINEQIMNKAESLLLRYSQAHSFQTEINSLILNKELKHDSRLRSLTPVIDENNLLRVGSRIGKATEVDHFTKFPIILDGKDHIARLLVTHYHINAAHSSNEMVVNELRQKYWLIRLRPTVRFIARQCLICRFRKASPQPPRLGDLPESRLTHHHRPFTMCGVDLFGPLEVVVGRQRVPRYGVLFTCLTVRAVHIEVVPSLTTDSMIMALRRMAARRGWPRMMFSDNGTNLRGADTELKKAYKEMVNNQQGLISETLNKGVEWQFIPPASPHMGGAWERLIRSVKTTLKVVLKERAPREETLITFLCEVENMINGRPLTHVSVDPRDPESLTPNHFLLGSSSNLPQVGIFDDSDLYLRKQWRISQRLADLFWSRWLKEVLPTLAPRKKWDCEGAQLKVGDLVVVVDPSSPRNVWPKGVIQKVYPGADGRVRVLDIKTKTGVMKRPASRVALLLGYECRSDDTKGEDVGDSVTARSSTA